ncbi:MAG: hypothetical protein WCL06_05350 [Bacteroidota bacterium]
MGAPLLRYSPPTGGSGQAFRYKSSVRYAPFRAFHYNPSRGQPSPCLSAIIPSPST